ncbi:MAG: hypothetical protein GDA36_09545 [Rhodobacteraceae bacterium]|nr:hypothetical protein [Paracoccaceae bacterium]
MTSRQKPVERQSHRCELSRNIVDDFGQNQGNDALPTFDAINVLILNTVTNLRLRVDDIGIEFF